MDITQRDLPVGRKWGRTGRKLVGHRTITVHNTANPGADAEAHARYLESGHDISWHFTVDHDSIVAHIPTDEQAWHTGTSAGNTTSIGIEVCEFTDERAQQAEANAVWLCAKLCRDLGMVPADVRTHKSWSGKECPRVILPHWQQFQLAVAKAYEQEAIVTDYDLYVIHASKEKGRKLLALCEAERLAVASRPWPKILGDVVKELVRLIGQVRG